MIQKLLFFVFTLTLISCGKYQEVKVEGVEKVEVMSISTSEIKVKIHTKVINPNNFKIKVLNGSFKVSSEGLDFGTFNISETVVIPKKSSGTVAVLVDTKLKSLFSPATLKLLSNLQKNKIPVTIDGHITASALFIKKAVPFKTTEIISL